MTQALLLLLALQFKHYCADYVLQTGYMLANKGTYGHPGGILHAGCHVVLTALLLVLAGAPALTIVAVCVVEFVVHYHVDWTKEQISRRAALAPDQANFWRVHGMDQALHQATYVAIVWWLYA